MHHICLQPSEHHQGKSLQRSSSCCSCLLTPQLIQHARAHTHANTRVKAPQNIPDSWKTTSNACSWSVLCQRHRNDCDVAIATEISDTTVFIHRNNTGNEPVRSFWERGKRWTVNFKLFSEGTSHVHSPRRFTPLRNFHAIRFKKKPVSQMGSRFKQSLHLKQQPLLNCNSLF